MNNYIHDRSEVAGGYPTVPPVTETCGVKIMPSVGVRGEVAGGYPTVPPVTEHCGVKIISSVGVETSEWGDSCCEVMRISKGGRLDVVAWRLLGPP